jgi:hypothetical protein
MYGDGYYSFDQSHQHQFGTDVTSNNPAEVRYFQSDPYDGSRPKKHSVHNPTNGNLNANPPVYTLPNQVSLIRSWNLVEGEQNYFVLSFENSQYSSPINGCIEFHFDQKKTVPNLDSIEVNNDTSWVTDIAPLEAQSLHSDYNKKLTWTFSTLKPNEQRFIYIPAFCDAKSMDRI